MRDSGGTEAHAKCGAKTRSGGTCQAAPMAGQARCRMHGGATPVARRAAAARLAAMEMARTVEVWGGRLDVTAPEALLELVQTKAAEVAYWNHRVSLLGDDARAGLLVAKSEQGVGPQGPVDTTTKQAGPHAFVVLLHKAQDQLASYSAAAVKAGIDEAMVRLVAAQSAAVIDLVRRAVLVGRERPDVAADQLLLELLPSPEGVAP